MRAGPPVSREEFGRLFARCLELGRQPAGDQRGALNHLRPEHVRAAAALVRSGRTVSCAWDLDTVRGPDNPDPVRHEMVFGFDATFGDSGELRIAGDRFAMGIHGDAHSHLDALCHVGFAGRVYGGVPLAEAVDAGGARTQGVDVARDGIVTRGVLIDLPGYRGVDWIEPGEAVGPAEFLAAEAATGTRIGAGDLVLIRTGHALRRARLGPWDAAGSKAGLHPTVLPLLGERRVVGAGYDGDGEAVPSPCPEVAYPVHALSLPALGWWTMDSLDLEDLARACREEGRREFLLCVAPLRLARGTGSPVNPVAVF